MKKLVFIFLTLCLKLCCAQPEKGIITNIVEYNEEDSTNLKLYSILKTYKCICIGEIHGTKEPSRLLIHIAKIFVSNGKSVIVGFEIPEEGMNESARNDTNRLAETFFFKVGYGDGRNSSAWLSAVKECMKLSIKSCFFAKYSDSLMYRKLIDFYEKDTNVVLVTISGNIHNKIAPHRQTKTMGCYLKEHFGERLFSINHIFESGMAYNLTTEGLKIHHITMDRIFDAPANQDKYLFKGSLGAASVSYDGFFYTKKVTPSLPIKAK